MASPFPFTSGQVLTAAQLNSIAEWTTFTPTFNNVTLGASGTSAGRYAEINDLVFYNATFDLNGTGSIGGAIGLALPVGTGDVSTTYPVSHQAWVRPNSGTIFNGMGITTASSILFYAYGAALSYSNAAGMDATIPITWTSDGLGYFAGWYVKA